MTTSILVAGVVRHRSKRRMRPVICELHLRTFAVECYNRRSAPGTVIACIEAFGTQGVAYVARRARDQGLGLGVEALLRAGGKAIADIARISDSYNRILTARFAYSFDASATTNKAWCNICGSTFPRFSARRRIPRQAFAVK